MRVNVTQVETWIMWPYWRGTCIWEVSIKGGSIVYDSPTTVFTGMVLELKEELHWERPSQSTRHYRH